MLCAPRIPEEKTKLTAHLIYLLVKLHSALTVPKEGSAGQGPVLNKVCHEAVRHRLMRASS